MRQGGQGQCNGKSEGAESSAASPAALGAGSIHLCWGSLEGSREWRWDPEGRLRSESCRSLPPTQGRQCKLPNS